MKMLVSDYDKTLYTSEKSISQNKTAIDNFRNNGNIFVIASGREYKYIKDKANKYNINYDYLICNNGSIIFDNKDNIIFASYLEIEIVLKLLKYLYNYKNYFNKITLYNDKDETIDFNNILEIIGFIKENK